MEINLLLKVAQVSENAVTFRLFSTVDRTTNVFHIKQTEDFGALRSTIFMQTLDWTFGVTVNKHNSEYLFLRRLFLVCQGKTSKIRRFSRNQSDSLQRSKRQTFSAPISDYSKFRKDLARSKMMNRMKFPGTSLRDLYKKTKKYEKNN